VVNLDTPLAEYFAVGKGQYQLLTGSLSWQGQPINNVTVAQPADRDCKLEVFSSVNDDLEFMLRIPWLMEDIEKKAAISLQIDVGKSQAVVVDLGTIALIEQFEAETTPAYTLGDDPLIAICMAIYEPDMQRFARQIESILCQSHENWVLIICDDASQSIDRNALEAVCNLDPRRIRLINNDANLGFYHNFERALAYVPDTAEFIAFADQDDIWYPDKLRKLVQQFAEDEVKLVYSDMRIVDDAGKVIADSYWQRRKNEFKDFDTIFLANTVTGAASMFRRELLENLLPFPPSIGSAFHDHWLACVALCQGRLAYIEEALYDYVQYDDSVIGHCDFDAGMLPKRNTTPDNTDARKSDWMDLYRKDYLRLQTMADTLKLRFPEQRYTPSLNLTNGDWRSALKLLKTYLKMRFSGRTSNHAELSLLVGWMVRKLRQ
jgi:glycosyltransferase involved in cell wall biosynthesis